MDDGKIHDQEFQKTPDRIRQRALTNMGYIVFRVKNEEVQNTPNTVAERIIQKYFEVADVDNDESKITKLNRPSNYNPITREIANNIQARAISLNKELEVHEERWSAEYFKDTLTRFHPELVNNQCAMERLILSLSGLNLHLGAQPYQASMISSLIAWGVFLVSINVSAKIVKLFKK